MFVMKMKRFTTKIAYHICVISSKQIDSEYLTLAETTHLSNLFKTPDPPVAPDATNREDTILIETVADSAETMADPGEETSRISWVELPDETMDSPQ